MSTTSEATAKTAGEANAVLSKVQTPSIAEDWREQYAYSVGVQAYICAYVTSGRFQNRFPIRR